MRSLHRLAPAALVAIVLCSGFAGAPGAAQTTAATPATPSLYQRLGGYDAIAAVTDDFIKRLATDATLSKFFIGLSNDSKARVRQLVVDQLCAATGGPCLYIGRDMKTSHAGLNITESDWQIAINDFNASLDLFKVGAPEHAELLAMLAKIKPDIVTAPGGK